MEQAAQEVVQAPAASPAASPAAPAEEQQAPAASPETEAPEKKTEGEEQHRSRAYRRLDRWRQRAIEAETRYKLLLEQQGQAKQAERQQPEQGSDEPKREQFDTYEEFIRADAKYHAEKAADVRARKVLDDSKKRDEQQRTQGEHERVTREWNAKVEKARDALDDFDEVCAESESPVTQAMSAAILESEHGALIAYHLAKNPAEAERISKLSPSKQAAAIVALEDKVKAPAKQPSSAPEPIKPVGQKGAEVQKDPSQMTDAEFAAMRRKQIAARR